MTTATGPGTAELAVGGQHLVLQGLRGTYGEIYLPLFGAHQASNAACALAAVEAFAGVAETVPGEDGATITLGPGLSSAGLDPGLVRAGFARASSPGRLTDMRFMRSLCSAGGAISRRPSPAWLGGARLAAAGRPPPSPRTAPSRPRPPPR